MLVRERARELAQRALDELRPEEFGAIAETLLHHVTIEKDGAKGRGDDYIQAIDRTGFSLSLDDGEASIKGLVRDLLELGKLARGGIRGLAREIFRELSADELLQAAVVVLARIEVIDSRTGDTTGALVQDSTNPRLHLRINNPGATLQDLRDSLL